MPVRDIYNNLDAQNALKEPFTGNATATGAIIDTADYDGGIMFVFSIANYTDGTYTPTIYESADSGMSGAALLSSDQILGTLADAIISADVAEGDALIRLGVVSTLRYLRVTMISSAVTTGADSLVTAIKRPEIVAVVQ